MARESEFPLWVAGQRVKIFLALFPSAVHLDPLTVSGVAASRILRAGLLPANRINRRRIFSTRDIALQIMVLLPQRKGEMGGNFATAAGFLLFGVRPTASKPQAL